MPGATFNMPDAFAAFGVRVADGAMTAGGSNPYLLTSATAAFKQTDVGKKVKVEGAGAAGADLTTTIKRLVSATKVELAAPALTTVVLSDISYVKGVYRLSDLILQGDVDGNKYQFSHARLIRLQNKHAATVIFIGGPYVTTANAGIALPTDASTDITALGGGVTSSDYLTSATANQKVNIYWQDELNQSIPAP
jgi:hypothetical protein